jgi:hypothetical protein
MKLLNQLIRQCQKELDKHPERANFPHWTFVVRDGVVISSGKNRAVEPLKIYGYHRREEDWFRPKLHAELDAVSRCTSNVFGLTIVNIRLNRLGEPKLAIPCRICHSLLSALKVKRILFTTEYGWGKL